MEQPHLRECRGSGYFFPRLYHRSKHLVGSSAPETSACLKNKRFWLDRIELLSNLQGQSIEELAEKLELSPKEFLNEFERREGPGVKTLSRLADYFEISLDHLADGKIDPEWIRQPFLPSMFQSEEGSRLRTSLAVTSWLAKAYGPSTADSILRTLRIPKKLMQNPDRRVRLSLLCSLLREARKRGIPEEGIFEIGLAAVFIPENIAIRSTLSKLKKPRELYECLFTQEISKFESNFSYNIIKSESHSITVHVTPRQSCLEENSANIITDRALSTYRWGVLSGLINVIDLPHAYAEVLKRATPYDLQETFRLDWTSSYAAISLSSRVKSISP